MRTIITLCLTFVAFCAGQAQNRYADSLRLRADHPQSAGDRIMALGELANFMRFRDIHEALALAQEAVALARAQPEARYRVYAYGNRAFVYLSAEDYEKADLDMDTCMAQAEETDDRPARSWAWYRKGRQLDFEGKPGVVEAQLKALDLTRGLGRWKEETKIYYALYGAYSSWGDLDNEDKYARLTLQAAQKSGDPNNLCEAWQAMSTAANDRYDKTKDPQLLDAALTAAKKAIHIYRQNEPHMFMEQLITIPSLNVANMYVQYFEPSPAITDSVLRYADITLRYAARGNDLALQAAVFGVLNADAQHNGDYEAAENYLNRALSLLMIPEVPDHYALAAVYEGLADLADRKNDHRRALQMYRAHMASYKKVYDSQLATAGKELEAKYQSREKEREIGYLKAGEAQRKKLNYLYMGIAVTLVLGLLFMFRAYYFRLRYSMQREKLLLREKEEARLHAKLKEEEARVLHAERQKAELYAQLQEEQAKLKAEEAARLQAEQQAMLAQREALQKEVLAGNLQVDQKNRALQNIKNRLEAGSAKEIKGAEINRIIKQQLYIDKDFEAFKTDLKEIHPEFYRRLQQKAHNKLTNLDLKYCAYIFLKRSTKEMAALLGVAPKSIRMSKYRLKQKLALDKDEDLDGYIRNVV